MWFRFIFASQFILALILYKVIIAYSAIHALIRAQTILAQQCLPKMTFDCFCSNVNRGSIVEQQWVTTMAFIWSPFFSTMEQWNPSSEPILAQHWAFGIPVLPNNRFQQCISVFADRQADIHDQSIRCSSLTLVWKTPKSNENIKRNLTI
jgi:hypothetical protein